MKLRYGITLALIFLMLIFYWMGLFDLISLQTIKNNRHAIELFISNHFCSALLVYFFIHALAVSLFLPFGAALNTIAGFLFGIWIGTLVALIAGTIGATIAFLIARYLFKDWFQERFEKKVRFFNHEIKLYGVYYLTGIHFIMGIPFALINIVAALSHATLTTFIITTLIGTIPSSCIHAYLGYLLRTFDTIESIIAPQTLLFILISILVFASSIIIRRYRKFTLQ